MSCGQAGLDSVGGTTVGGDHGDNAAKALHGPPFDFTGTVSKVAVDCSGEAGQDDDGEGRPARENLPALAKVA